MGAMRVREVLFSSGVCRDGNQMSRSGNIRWLQIYQRQMVNFSGPAVLYGLAKGRMSL
jgi:hypothetical protein